MHWQHAKHCQHPDCPTWFIAAHHDARFCPEHNLPHHRMRRSRAAAKAASAQGVSTAPAPCYGNSPYIKREVDTSGVVAVDVPTEPDCNSGVRAAPRGGAESSARDPLTGGTAGPGGRRRDDRRHADACSCRGWHDRLAADRFVPGAWATAAHRGAGWQLETQLLAIWRKLHRDCRLPWALWATQRHRLCWAFHAFARACETRGLDAALVLGDYAKYVRHVRRAYRRPGFRPLLAVLAAGKVWAIHAQEERHRRLKARVAPDGAGLDLAGNRATLRAAHAAVRATGAPAPSHADRVWQAERRVAAYRRQYPQLADWQILESYGEAVTTDPAVAAALAARCGPPGDALAYDIDAGAA